MSCYSVFVGRGNVLLLMEVDRLFIGALYLSKQNEMTAVYTWASLESRKLDKPGLHEDSQWDISYGP